MHVVPHEPHGDTDLTARGRLRLQLALGLGNAQLGAEGFSVDRADHRHLPPFAVPTSAPAPFPVAPHLALLALPVRGLLLIWFRHHHPGRGRLVLLYFAAPHPALETVVAVVVTSIQWKYLEGKKEGKKEGRKEWRRRDLTYISILVN